LEEISNTSLEDAENKLERNDKVQFLEFTRIQKWKPEERSTARELGGSMTIYMPPRT
jgi:hypothetical protein